MDIILIYLLGSLIIGGLMYFTRDRLINYLLFVPFLGLQLMLVWHEYSNLNVIEGYYLGVDKEGFFKSDEIGLIFLIVLTITAIPIIINSYWYSVYQRDKIMQVARYNMSMLMLIVAMSCALITQHVALTWAFIEATTLAASLLIYHEANRAALEATWKYIFICSIGIAFSFIGILFLSIASKDATTLDLTLEGLRENAKSLDPNWLKITFLLIITGYSVKMGIAPLFTVDIDAKDVAPAPVGAMLSAGLMNVGFVAIFRFYDVFSETSIKPWMNQIILIVGLASIFFATIYILRVKNIKRLLAYSSLEHAGIALLALGAGGQGYFAVIFHLVIHAFAKATLFLQTDHLTRLFRHKNIDLMGSYYKINPIGGFLFILGFMVTLGIPPSGLFISEYYTIVALLKSQHYIIIVIALFLLSFIFYALSKNMLKILFSKPSTPLKIRYTVHPAETISQWLMLGLVFYISINPPKFFVDFIYQAVEHLGK